MGNNINRREFIKKSALAGLTVALAPEFMLGKEQKKRKVKIGLIGVGLRGCSHLRNILERNDVIVPAICDIDPERIKVAQALIEKAGKKKAAVYSSGDFAFEKMLDRDDIEGVIISTPWLWHTRMAVSAMKKGKYSGVEVSAANTVQECWDLVNTYEATHVPCMILENVCYRRDVMAVLNMVRKGIFGELIHCRCGYQHDLRGVKFYPGVEFGEKGEHEAKWRTTHSINRNGDVYPTHGVGPVANFLNINRGNKFVSLTSTSTKARGLHKYIVDNAGQEHPNASIKWKLGDVVTTVITTANKESIVVTHDTNSPRPYSLGFRVQGTKGIWMKNGDSIFIEGRSEHHKWESSEPYLKEYDHPLWKRYSESAEGSGHGGMDFFVENAFIESVKRRVKTPLDAYDAASWSVISPLSEKSIAEGGEPQQFPDFTRGRWMTRKPVFALNDDY